MGSLLEGIRIKVSTFLLCISVCVTHEASTKGWRLLPDGTITPSHCWGKPTNLFSSVSKPVCTRCSKFCGAEILSLSFFFLLPNMVLKEIGILHRIIFCLNTNSTVLGNTLQYGGNVILLHAMHETQRKHLYKIFSKIFQENPRRMFLVTGSTKCIINCIDIITTKI